MKLRHSPPVAEHKLREVLERISCPTLCMGDQVKKAVRQFLPLQVLGDTRGAAFVVVGGV